MASPACKVFISYSHDSDLHKQRVLLLADRLNGDGLDTRLDQYIEDQPPADWRGWPNWMRQMIEQADFVLVVCTETYRRRYEGKEDAGRGLGGSWEGAIITEEIYEAHSRNTKFIPVFFDESDASHIPVELRPFNRYMFERDYEKLYRLLTSQPEIAKPPTGNIRALPERKRHAGPAALEASRSDASGAASPTQLAITSAAFDVFFIYNSQDKPEVRPLANALGQRGIKVWLDEWEIRPGQQWQSELERAISSVHSAAILVGGSGIGPWQSREMEAVLESFLRRGLPVIPVLLPQAPERIALPIFLRMYTWVDLREGLNEEPLERLIWGITGKKPTTSPSITSGTTHELREPADLEQVFSTSALPTYTYVEPAIYRHVASDLRQHGKHVLIAGPSGSGKTCLVFKLLKDAGLKEDSDFQYISALTKKADQAVLQRLQAALSTSDKNLLVVDDFHLLKKSTRLALGSGLKQLSDLALRRPNVTKFVLVGISSSGEGLLFNTTDLGPRLGVYRMPLATEGDLRNLIRKGETRLEVEFSNPDHIITESANSFFLCQYLCREVCLENNITRTTETHFFLDYRIEDIRRNLLDQLMTRFKPILTFFIRSNGAAVDQCLPLLAVIAAISGIHKSLLSLSEIAAVAGEAAKLIHVMKDRMASLIHTSVRGGKLEKYLFYEEDSELFSVEDPIFRYYLDHLDIIGLSESLGITPKIALEIAEIQDLASQKYAKSISVDKDTQLREVFISYSHKDTEWFNFLLTHLRPVLRGTRISAWPDSRVSAGASWRDEIARDLYRARVAVLLVSPNFLGSDFIAEHELLPPLEAAEKQGLVILWVYVSSCLYDETEIGHYQAAHDISKPLASLRRAAQDAVMAEISRKIKTAGATP